MVTGFLVGTHEGLAVYEDGKWKTYTTEDGLAHNGVLAIDVSEQTGDVWIGTMGGLSSWSTGTFENFTQMNSGMPNDLIYAVTCDGKMFGSPQVEGPDNMIPIIKNGKFLPNKMRRCMNPGPMEYAAGMVKFYCGMGWGRGGIY